MGIYRKPYFEEIFHVKPSKCHYPYSDELIRKYEIFPLLVLDGGAFFFLKEHIGGEADGKTILDAYESGKLFDIWSKDGKLDWNLAFRNSSVSKLRNTFEHIVWIHRFYFLLPVARQFFITGNEKLAEKWFDNFEDWTSENPYRTYEGDPYDGDLVWFDMQVCWRLLVLMHSVNMLSKSSYLSRSKWEKIYRSIELHANQLLHEGQGDLELGVSGANHFLQKGAALLFAGLMFPGFGSSGKYIETGRGIIRDQMKNQILPDGGSVESSPSYNHFIARQYVEAFVLMEKNGAEGLEGLKDCINRQYEWMFQASTPKGDTLQINDSYALNALQDIDIVSEIFPLDISREKTSILFKESNFAILRNERFDIYVDAMKLTEDHQHLGKPNFLVYADKLPLLVDSGCCNYDSHLREDYLMGRFAHNVIVIPEFEDENVPVFVMEDYFKSLNSEMKITDFSTNKSESTVKIIHSMDKGGIKINWQRCITMEDSKVRVRDLINSEKDITCRQIFHFAPWNILLSEDRTQATIFFKDRDVIFEHVKKNCRFRLEYYPAYNDRNEMTFSPTLVSELKSTVCEFETVLALDT